MATRARPQPRSFAAGELAPWLDGITSEVTVNGARTLLNFIVKKNGAAVRRPGTFYAGEVKTSSDSTILVPVVIDDDNRYVLEIGDAYIRFWNQSTHAVVGGVGSEYEVTSPWSVGELSDLRWAYEPTEKAVYWVHRNHPIQKLEFNSSNDWDMGQVGVWTNAPWLTCTSSQLRSFLVPGLYQEAEEVGALYEGNEVSAISIDHNGSLYVVILRDLDDTVTRIVGSSDGRSWVELDQPSNVDSVWTVNPRNMIAHNPQGKIGIAGSGTFYFSDYGLQWNEVTVETGVPFSTVGVEGESNAWRIFGGTSSALRVHFNTNNGFPTWGSVTMPAGSLAPPDMWGGARVFREGNFVYWIAWTDRNGSGEIYTDAAAGSFTTTFTSASAAITDIVAGEVDGDMLWLASVGSDILSSSVGVSWTTVASPGAFASLNWTGNRFVGLQESGFNTTIYTSDDGTSWTAEDSIGLPAVTGEIVAAPSPPYKQPTFRESGDYPGAIALHEGRMYLASTTNRPSTMWGSRTGDSSNFFIGENAGDALEIDILGPANVDIRWMIGGNDLVVGTRTAEGVLRGEPGVGITGQARSFLWQSNFGSKSLQPVRVNDHVVFAQRGGEVIRGFVPGAGTESWKSPDLTARADHVASGGITEIDHQEDPWNIVWFTRADGQLLACTFDGTMSAWSRQATYTNDGSTTLVESDIESIAIIPTGSAEDEIWMVVERTIDSSTVRYIEYMDTLNVASKEDAHFVDSGVEKTDSVTFATMGGLTHLIGENVDALIDGNLVLNDLTVSASGNITFTAGYSGTQAHAGLPYDSYIQTMRTEAGSQWGSAAGMNRRTNNLLVWVYDTLGGRFGPTQARAEADAIPSELNAGSFVFDGSETVWSGNPLVTDIVSVDFDGDWNRDNYVWVVQNDPLPMTVIGLAPDITTGDD